MSGTPHARANGPPVPPADPLARQVDALERRVARLEELLQARAAPPVEAPPAAPTEEPRPPARIEEPAPLALAGRALIAIGGGYLLRAGTEAQAWPAAAGALVGLLYAAAWVLSADRALARGRPVAGHLDGATAVLVAYPLLWESATRFAAWTPDAAVAAAATLALAASTLALKRGAPALAWAHALATVLLAAALVVATHHLAAVVLALAALHAGGEAAGDRRLAPGLRWATAVPLDLALSAVLFVASQAGGPRPGHPELPPAAAGALVAATAVALLAHTAWRAWTRPLQVFDAAHGAVLLGLTTVALARLPPGALVSAGVVALVLAVIVDVQLERRSFPGWNAPALALTAVALAVAATVALLPPGPRPVAWALLGLAAARRGRGCAAHRFTAAALVAAALVGGGGVASLAALAGRLGAEPPTPGLVAAACAALAGWALLAGLPFTVLGAWGAVTLALAVLPATGSLAEAGGTPVLCVFAVGMLVVGRRAGRTDVARAAAALLAVAGLRLALVDLPGGRPGPLFVGLVSYGAALLAAQALRSGDA